MVLAAWLRSRAFPLALCGSAAALLTFCAQTIRYNRDVDYCAPATPLDESNFCRMGTVEDINDAIAPQLDKLLGTSFFRYYKINLSRPCPFWKEDLICTSQGCSIATLPKDPNGWEAKLSDIRFPTFQLAGSIFRAWEYDDDDFCLLDGEGEAGVYVDLIENPERFTGYAGPSANRVWKSIYEENCFNNGKETFSLSESTWQQCVERRIFYRVISGLHASISVHLADEYYNQQAAKWESNFGIFNERVGKHLDRVQNLYMLYMLLYRAVGRVSTKIEGMTFNANDPEDDNRIRGLLIDILSNAPKCPGSYDKSLFSTSTKIEIIEEFKDHFRNVTRIMDCVSCERCRLWGKIQTTGIGTALKILFVSDDKERWESTKLRRSEIIALFNALGRVSGSIQAVQKFRTYHEEFQKEGGSVVSATLEMIYLLIQPVSLIAITMAVLSTLVLSWRASRKGTSSKQCNKLE